MIRKKVENNKKNLLISLFIVEIWRIMGHFISILWRQKNPMGKGEIAWKGQFEDGRPRQVRAQRVRKVWRFFEREKRFDSWRPLARPSLEDWRLLLDGLERRAQRQAAAAEEAQRIRRRMKERFPE